VLEIILNFAYSFDRGIFVSFFIVKVGEGDDSKGKSQNGSVQN
jgi:hypothetical protein